MNYLDISSGDKHNKRIIMRIWLAQLMNCEAEFCRVILRKFKAARGSPNLLVNQIAQPPKHFQPPEVQSPAVSHIERQAQSNLTTGQGSQQAVNGNGPGNIDVRPHDNAGQMGLALNFARVPNNGTHGPRTHSDATHSMHQQTGLNSNTDGNFSAANLVSHDDRKRANYVSQMFKTSQFSGQIKHDILETIKMYAIFPR